MDTAPRFRKIKKSLKSQHSSSQSSQTNKHHNSTLPQIACELYLGRRLKALLVDVFMIYTPIVYLAYIIIGGAQEFRESQPVIFLCFLAYACISAAFIAKTGQTPGLRYVELRLVRADYAESTCPANSAARPESNKTDLSKEQAKNFTLDSRAQSANPESKTSTIGFWRALLREFAWAFSCAIMIGFIAPFIGNTHRKSHQCLHDVWCGTRIIEAPATLKKQK